MDNSHQQTCFAACTVADDDELSADLSHGVWVRGYGRVCGREVIGEMMMMESEEDEAGEIDANKGEAVWMRVEELWSRIGRVRKRELGRSRVQEKAGRQRTSELSEGAKMGQRLHCH